MAIRIGRRDLMAAFGGAAAAWPLVAYAQQPERMRRVGVLLGGAEGDQLLQAGLTKFKQSLSEHGWTEGRNIRTEYR